MVSVYSLVTRLDCEFRLTWELIMCIWGNVLLVTVIVINVLSPPLKKTCCFLIPSQLFIVTQLQWSIPLPTHRPLLPLGWSGHIRGVHGLITGDHCTSVLYFPNRTVALPARLQCKSSEDFITPVGEGWLFISSHYVLLFAYTHKLINVDLCTVAQLIRPVLADQYLLHNYHAWLVYLISYFCITGSKSPIPARSASISPEPIQTQQQQQPDGEEQASRPSSGILKQKSTSPVSASRKSMTGIDACTVLDAQNLWLINW